MKSIYSVLIFLFFSYPALSCDFCNCYLGLDPGFNKNTIGIRNSWRTAEWTPFSSTQRSAHTDHGTGEEGSGSKLDESFVTMELYVKYAPVSKLRLIMTLPYTFNTIEYKSDVESRNAMSDMTLMALYQLFNSMPVDSHGVRHRIFVGPGVKFPTGKSEGASDVEIPLSHHLYSGTGSTDYLLNVSYIGKVKKLGWNVDASYKFNGESATDYRYGNTLNVIPRVFYEIGLGQVKLYPHIGGAYEMGDEDEFKGETWPETGGSTVWGSAGADAYYGSFSVTTDFRLPIAHDLGAQVPEDKFWLFTSLNFNF
jgi:hypothetical protein